MLNADQTRVFHRVSSHLFHQKQHETKLCDCSTSQPLQIFVTGIGGTGKSFLIELIRDHVANVWNEKTNSLICCVAAPTGLAAFNIGGVTVPRLFQLPIEQEEKTATYWRLPKQSIKIMREKSCDLKLIIIDEVSMLSNLNLAYLHIAPRWSVWFGQLVWLYQHLTLRRSPATASSKWIPRIWETQCQSSLVQARMHDISEYLERRGCLW